MFAELACKKHHMSLQHLLLGCMFLVDLMACGLRELRFVGQLSLAKMESGPHGLFEGYVRFQLSASFP